MKFLQLLVLVFWVSFVGCATSSNETDQDEAVVSTSTTQVSQEGIDKTNSVPLGVQEIEKESSRSEPETTLVKDEPSSPPPIAKSPQKPGPVFLISKNHFSPRSKTVLGSYRKELQSNPDQEKVIVRNLVKRNPHAALKMFREGNDSTRELLTSVLENELKSAPENERFHNLLGTFYLELGELAPSQKEFEKVVEINPAFAAGYLNLAAVHGLQNQSRKAILNARISEKIYAKKNNAAGTARAQNMLSLFYDSFKTTPDEEGVSPLGFVAVSSGKRVERAEGSDSTPGSAENLYARGTNNFQAKSMTDGQNFSGPSEKVSSDLSENGLEFDSKAGLTTAEGEGLQAKVVTDDDTEISSRPESDPSDSLANEEQTIRNKITFYQDALLSKPGDPELLFFLGSKHYVLGRFLERRSEGFLRTEERLKDSEEAIKNYDEGIKNLEGALAKVPKSAGAHFNLALNFFVKKEMEKAIVHMRESERLFAEIDNGRGMAKSKKTLREWYDEYGFDEEGFH